MHVHTLPTVRDKETGGRGGGVTQQVHHAINNLMTKWRVQRGGGVDRTAGNPLTAHNSGQARKGLVGEGGGGGAGVF